MVVAIVRAGVSGSAWLAADACRLGARMPRPAPAWVSPAAAAARAVSRRRIIYPWHRRPLILTVRGNQAGEAE